MPRAMWRGAISFGLVTIPVTVYPATEEKTLRFNQLHDEDGGRIRYKRVCEKDGEEVPFEHIVKGYEVEKDRYVILTDDDFDAVPVESSRAIDIERFVDLDEIDPIMFKKSYFLVPEETGAKAYALLREAMSEDGRVGIAKVSFRDKEHLSLTLLSDPDKAVLTAWGAYGEKKLYGKLVQGVIRSTFVVGEDGTVEHAFHNVKATGHVAKLRRDLGLNED